MEKLNKVFKTIIISEIDKYTIENETISSLGLMERASRAWVDLFYKKFNSSRNITIIAGNGNNGGDGYAIARLLKDRGLHTEVFRLQTGAAMSSDCEANYKRYCQSGGDVWEVEDAGSIVLQSGRIIVDALFGSGLNRNVTGLAAEVIQKMNRSRNTVVAVDIPSGLMGEDNAGNDREYIVRADYTFTFQFPKLAFMLAENSEFVGEWTVLDIGLDSGIIERLSTPYYYITEDRVAWMLPKAGKFAHKGINGHGLLIAGKDGMMGAAVLAARAALRSGVGLLYCHTPVRNGNIIQLSVPEALVVLDKSDVCFSGVDDVMKYDAVAVGPAIGRQPETVRGLRNLLMGWRGITILDADALNIISEHGDLLPLLHDKCILTPHPGEFERLAGKCENDFERLNKLSTFASRYHVYMVLKGAHSVVATPNGDLCFNMSGNPGMAKGGAGDVLTGVLLALAANGLQPLDVALIGVFAHGLAGDLIAGEVGIRGLCSGMLAEGMGKAWKSLEAFSNNKSEYLIGNLKI